MPNDNLIQARSYVLVLDKDCKTIVAVSENFPTLGGGDAGALLGSMVTEVLPPGIIESVIERRNKRVVAPVKLPSTGLWGNGSYYLLPHHIEGGMIVEIEPWTEDGDTYPGWEIGLLEIAELVSDAPDISTLLHVSCRKISQYLGFERVLIYQLETISNGIVRSEYRADESLGSLLGIRFREQDFPDDAVRLHLQGSVLSFQLDHKDFVPITGNLSSAAEDCINYYLECRTPYPDLSEFMEESGLRSTMSVGLSIDGKLWGVLFGHSRKPIHLNHRTRSFSQLVAKLIKQAITFRNFDLSREDQLTSSYIRLKVRENVASAPTLLEGLSRTHPALQDFLSETNGAAFTIDDQVRTIGESPPLKAVKNLFTWAEGYEESQDYICTDNLSAIYPRAAELSDWAAGVIMVSLNKKRTDWIAWFRPEHVQEVVFGSVKDSESIEEGKRFSPIIEKREGYSKPWKIEDLTAAQELQEYLRELMNERYTELSRINQRLKAAYDEMEAFSYTVSHDLRAPLRGIDGFAEILMEEYGEEISADGRALISTIQYNAARMNQFISDILELSRIGRVTLSLEDIDVENLVERTLPGIVDEAREIIKVEVEDGIPPIRGDRQQIGVVFKHLLSNAVKYTSKEASRKITVGFRPSDDDANGEFYVSDNGIGIAAGHHQRIFGMFNRLVSEQDYEGTGVGLALVRRIIQRHNGGIRVESNLGEGTTFLFYTDPAPQTK